MSRIPAAARRLLLVSFVWLLPVGSQAQNWPRQQALQARQLIAEDPSDMGSRAKLARSLAERGACSEALEHLAQMRADGTVWTGRTAAVEGACHLRMGHLSSAVAAFEEALVFDSSQALARYRLGELGLETGDLELVDEQLAFFASSERTERTYNLLDFEQDRYLGLLDMQVESELLRRSLEGQGVRRPAQNALIEEGLYWLDQGHPSAAIDVFGDVLDANVQRWEVSLYRAEAYRRMGMQRQVEVIMDRTLLRKVDVAWKTVVLARLRVDQGRLDEAQALVDSLDGADATIVIETEWYLARARKDMATAAHLSELWTARNVHPQRSLELLIAAPLIGAPPDSGDNE